MSHAIAASLQGFISLKAFIFPLTICHPICRADEKADHLTGALLVSPLLLACRVCFP
jgi:hypothetical protein